MIPRIINEQELIKPLEIIKKVVINLLSIILIILLLYIIIFNS